MGLDTALGMVPDIGIEGGAAIPFADNFARADGPLGNGWTGATWTISSGAALNTPNVTQTLLNSTFAAWTANDPDNWTVAAEDANNYVNENAGGGSADMVSDGSTSLVLSQTVAGQANKIFQFKLSGTLNSGTFRGRIVNSSASALLTHSAIPLYRTGTVNSGGGPDVQVLRAAAGTNMNLTEARFDVFSTAELMATQDYGTAQAYVGAALTISQAGTHTGVSGWVDDAATPLNYVRAVHDGGSAILLIKCVAGVETVLISGAGAYAAGGVIEIRRTTGNTFQLWYNAVQIGTDQTISDAGIINNTRYGMFATNPAGSIDNFFVNPPTA